MRLSELLLNHFVPYDSLFLNFVISIGYVNRLLFYRVIWIVILVLLTTVYRAVFGVVVAFRYFKHVHTHVLRFAITFVVVLVYLLEIVKIITQVVPVRLVLVGNKTLLK